MIDRATQRHEIQHRHMNPGAADRVWNNVRCLRRRPPFIAAALAMGMLAASSVASAGTLYTLPVPAGFEGINTQTGLSADGSTFVGGAYIFTGTTYFLAYRWTPSSGLTLLPAPVAGYSAYGTAVSSDGSIIVGASQDNATNTSGPSWVWTASTGTVALTLPNLTRGGNELLAEAARVVAGTATGGSNQASAFVWTPEGGIETLGLPPPNFLDRLAPDGLMAGGRRCAAQCVPFVWTRTEGVTDISLPAGAFGGEVTALSNNKRVAVVNSTDTFGNPLAVRWSPSGGSTPLNPGAGDNRTQAWHVTPDGSTVLGRSCNLSSSSFTCRAAIWSEGSSAPQIIVGAGDLRSELEMARAGGEYALGSSCAASNFASCRPLLWTPELGAQTITLPAGYSFSRVSSARRTAFGWAAVGTATYPSGDMWFWWSPATGALLQPNPAGQAFTSDVEFIGDGSLIWLRSCANSRCTEFVTDRVSPPRTVQEYVHDVSGIDVNAWQYAGLSDLHSSSVLAGPFADASEIGRVFVLDLRDAAGPTVTTPSGSVVAVSPLVTLPGGGTTSVDLTFGQVQIGGSTTVTAASTPGGGASAAPPAFKAGTPPVYYDVTTTATFSGAVTLCFSWAQGQFQNESNIKLFHFETGVWKNVTTSLDTDANRVCGQVTSLSPFALFESTLAFTGFFSPVDNSPIVNSVKAGSAVPVKFSLGGDKGLNVFAAGYPGSQSVSCASAASDAIEETSTAGSSGLTYDATTDRYSYVWKTDKAWASSCRRLVLKFIDGALYQADFRFTK